MRLRDLIRYPTEMITSRLYELTSLLCVLPSMAPCRVVVRNFRLTSSSCNFPSAKMLRICSDMVRRHGKSEWGLRMSARQAALRPSTGLPSTRFVCSGSTTGQASFLLCVPCDLRGRKTDRSATCQSLPAGRQAAPGRRTPYYGQTVRRCPFRPLRRQANAPRQSMLSIAGSGTTSNSKLCMSE